jgi:hypothetical protein
MVHLFARSSSIRASGFLKATLLPRDGVQAACSVVLRPKLTRTSDNDTYTEGWLARIQSGLDACATSNPNACICAGASRVSSRSTTYYLPVADLL